VEYTGAPKALNIKARGKREARRPWIRAPKQHGGLKGRNIISPCSGLWVFLIWVTRGDALRACPWLRARKQHEGLKGRNIYFTLFRALGN
jgi:hypothetical protein